MKIQNLQGASLNKWVWQCLSGEGDAPNFLEWANAGPLITQYHITTEYVDAEVDPDTGYVTDEAYWLARIENCPEMVADHPITAAMRALVASHYGWEVE
jgi:hypothetical protein